MIEFRLLGPFEVLRDGAPLELGPHRQRAVLAALTIHANRVVSLDQLIDELWGEEPPAQAIGTLQAYVSNLRRVLEPGRSPREAPRILVTQSPGYVLRIPLEALDVFRFQSLTAEARGTLRGLQCLPGGGLTFLLEAEGSTLRLHAPSPVSAMLYGADGEPLERDLVCGSHAESVTAWYKRAGAGEPADADGTLLSLSFAEGSLAAP